VNCFVCYFGTGPTSNIGWKEVSARLEPVGWRERKKRISDARVKYLFFFTLKEADDKHRLGMTIVSDFCLECRVIVKYRQSIRECLLKIELFSKGNLRRVEEEETLLER